MLKPATIAIPFLAQSPIRVTSDYLKAREILYSLRISRGPAECMMIEQVIKMVDKDIDKYLEQLKTNDPTLAQLLTDRPGQES